MAIYTVRRVVCDYGVLEDEYLKLICNSRSNALLIAAIMEKDDLCSLCTHDDYVFNINDAEMLLGEKE